MSQPGRFDMARDRYRQGTHKRGQGRYRRRRAAAAARQALTGNPGQPSTPPAIPTPQNATQRPTPQSHQDGGGEGGITETPFFERPQETRSDVNLIKLARRKRWDTDKNLGELLIKKLAHKALGLEWNGPDGMEKAVEFSPPQLIGAAKLMLDVERQNQAEEHHIDRLEYAERALTQRHRGVMAKAQVNMGRGSDGEASASVGIQVYLPDNGRGGDVLDIGVDPVQEDDLLNG